MKNEKQLLNIVDDEKKLCVKCGTKSKIFATINMKTDKGGIYYHGYWCLVCNTEIEK